MDNSVSGQLNLHLTPVTNAYGYEVQMRTGGADWKTVKYGPAARSLIVSGLVTATTYDVRVRAPGGSTGASDWSIPGSRIVT